ncbi:MAG: RluA family pseudouridine synthase [Lachnospiraceae bacterium]|nr:RluA family pseudouridine synthase [Lachnospiraceae bacterium]
MKEYTLTAEEDYENERIDRYLSLVLADLSRSYIQKLIEQGNVTANGKNVKSSFRVSAGDRIIAITPDALIPDIIPEDIPLDILYEDTDVLVVNKPKGMVVHPAPGHYEHTLVNALMYYCRDALSGINGIMRPGIVHRIDKDTTGSVIICKNDAAHNNIAKQLKEHTIKREYIAIVTGSLKDDKGTIDKPLGRSRSDRKKMAIMPDGKRAVTHYEVIKRLNGFTMVRCRLETGRTHQIRVHMASIGHPVAGDSVYGNGAKTPVETNGQALHAHILGFTQPQTGEYIETTAPVPDYMVRFAEVCEKV